MKLWQTVLIVMLAVFAGVGLGRGGLEAQVIQQQTPPPLQPPAGPAPQLFAQTGYYALAQSADADVVWRIDTRSGAVSRCRAADDPADPPACSDWSRLRSGGPL